MLGAPSGLTTPPVPATVCASPTCLAASSELTTPAAAVTVSASPGAVTAFAAIPIPVAIALGAVSRLWHDEGKNETQGGLTTKLRVARKLEESGYGADVTNHLRPLDSRGVDDLPQLFGHSYTQMHHTCHLECKSGVSSGFKRALTWRFEELAASNQNLSTYVRTYGRWVERAREEPSALYKSTYWVDALRIDIGKKNASAPPTSLRTYLMDDARGYILPPNHCYENESIRL